MKIQLWYLWEEEERDGEGDEEGRRRGGEGRGGKKRGTEELRREEMRGKVEEKEKRRE